MLVTTTAQWYYRFPSCAFLGFPTTEKKKKAQGKTILNLLGSFK